MPAYELCSRWYCFRRPDAMVLWSQNTAGTAGVTSVSVRSSNTNGAWIPMNNAFGADWEMPNSPAQPLDMLIGSDDGSSVSTGPPSPRYAPLFVSPPRYLTRAQQWRKAPHGFVRASSFATVGMPVQNSTTYISNHQILVAGHSSVVSASEEKHWPGRVDLASSVLPASLLAFPDSKLR